MSVSYDVAGYNNGEDVIPKGAFRISPSSVARFFNEKRDWYGEFLLGEPKKFTGSDSTTIGTICHQIAEVVAECKIQNEKYDSDKMHNAIEEYIQTFEDNEEYDTSIIRQHWKNMAEPLVKDYVLQTNTLTTEDFIKYEVSPGIYVAGSMDAITSSAPTDTWEDAVNGTAVGILSVRDFKTASKLPSTMTWAYTIQAYTYAYILRKMGINIQEVELCYTVRPTKTLPVRTKRFTKPFDDQAFKYIDGILHLIAESVEAYKEYPACRHLLAGDYRLKED